MAEKHLKKCSVFEHNGEDFFNGDVVQIANEYGHETKARIVEIVMTEDSDGASVYPTFKTTEGGDE